MSELTIGETALLAGLISSPEGNSPFNYPDRAIRRRADVLRGEVETGYITQAQADAANLEPLPTVPPPAEQRPTNYLVAEVQDRLLADPRLGDTLEERRAKLLKGGLSVYTTFDRRLQAIAEDATTNAAAVQRKGGVGAGGSRRSCPSSRRPAWSGRWWAGPTSAQTSTTSPPTRSGASPAPRGR